MQWSILTLVIVYENDLPLIYMIFVCQRISHCGERLPAQNCTLTLICCKTKVDL